MQTSHGTSHKTHAGTAKRASAAKPGKKPEGAAPPVVREERIRQIAYGFYEQRGYGDGQQLDDWLKAEAMIDDQPAGDLQALASAASGH
jgi:Protein of unknown function (DUF2934)